MHKIAKTYEQANTMQDKKLDQPHGWIQWKGTDVCMDVRCVCGQLLHIDDEFVYMIGCSECGRVYYTSGYIELIELEDHGESYDKKLIKWAK